MSDKNRIAYYKGELNKHLKSLESDFEKFSEEKLLELENKIELVKEIYNKFFEGENSLSGKIEIIENSINDNSEKYEYIKKYYSELFEGETSIKKQIENLLKELIGYKEKNEEINNFYKKLFEGNENEEAIIDIIEQVEDKIKEYEKNLFDGEESLSQKINLLVSKLEDYEDKYIGIIDYYNELLEGDEENRSIKTKIQDTFNDIKNYKNELLDGIDGESSIKDKIDFNYKKIKEYYNFIYGIDEELDSNGKVIKEGKQGFKEKLENLYKEKQSKYKELENKIESLLPGATSAGLSSAYREMKESFYWPKWIWSGIFIIVLLIAIYLGKDIEVGEDLDKTLLIIISHLPYILPLIWLAYFASKQQSQNIRLEQEYAHKESLAKSFEGYKKQIDELGEDEESIKIKKMLMENIVKMTGENPSETLDKNHGTNPPIWEYIFGGKEKIKK